MQLTSFRVPATASLLALLLLAGCQKAPEEFHNYSELDRKPSSSDATTETETPVQPPQDGSTTAPADQQASVSPTETPAATIRQTPADSVPEEAAIAELPVQLLLDAENRAARAIAAVAPAEEDPVAVAEIMPGDVLLPPRKVELLIPHREFKTEAGALRVSFDDLDLLKVLNMEPVTPNAPELLPDWMKSLNGKRIRIRGFMYPPFEETGLRRFVLARDNQICCFGRNPKVYDLIIVDMRDGVTTDYIPNRPFDVVGVFHIDPTGDAHALDQLYKIEDAVVVVR